MSEHSGWHPLPPAPVDAEADDWAVHDGLYIGGRCVAVVEAFSENGPWYANAIKQDGTRVRAGAIGTQADAMGWCEEITGVRPLRAHSTIASEQEGAHHG